MQKPESNPACACCAELPAHLESLGMHMPPKHYCGYAKTNAGGQTEVLVIRNDHKAKYTLPELAAHFAAKTGPYAPTRQS